MHTDNKANKTLDSEKTTNFEKDDIEDFIQELADIYTAKHGTDYEKYFNFIVRNIAHCTASALPNFGRTSDKSKNAREKFISILTGCMSNYDLNSVSYSFYDPFAVLCGIYAGILLHYDPVRFNSMLEVNKIFYALGVEDNEIIKYFERYGGDRYKKFMVDRVINNGYAYGCNFSDEDTERVHDEITKK